MAVVSVAAVVAVCAAVVSVFVLVPRVGVVAALALVVADIALVPFAVRRRPGLAATNSGSERFERGFDDAAIGMLILTPQLAITRVNEALCALLGRHAELLVGRSILEFTHPDDLRRSVAKRTALLGKGADAPLVNRYLRPDGSIVEAVVTTALVEAEGAEPYFFSQLQDLLAETRFSVPAMTISQGMRRGLSVPVPERSGARHVILANAHGEGRPFSGEDARFLEHGATPSAG